MSAPAAISTCQDDQDPAGPSTWIQVAGKGSFQASPTLRKIACEQLAGGAARLVIDLGPCTCVDSTFMGTLAELGLRLSADPSATLQIADAPAAIQSSLEELGLDHLLDINPSPAPWDGRLDAIRASLVPADCSPEADPAHILEAHRKLCEADPANAEKFATVIEILEKQACEE